MLIILFDMLLNAIKTIIKNHFIFDRLKHLKFLVFN